MKNISGYNKFLIGVFLSGSVLFLIFVFLDNFVSSINIEIQSVVFSWILCTLNVIIGVRFIVSAVDKEQKSFIVSLFGGMIIRLVAVLCFVLLGLLVFHFEEAGFIVSLFCFYFLFLIFEVYFIANLKKQKVLNT